MANLQQIFDRIQKTKKEQKEIKSIYRDALLNSQAMKQVQEDLLKLRDKKKRIEEGIRDDFRHEFDKLEVLKADIENDAVLLSDIALNEYIKGNSIEIKDEYENRYEPIFAVRFKKV